MYEFNRVDPQLATPGDEALVAAESFCDLDLTPVASVARRGAGGAVAALRGSRRQGREAILLERLCNRDDLPLDEAIERIRTEHGISRSRPELEQIAATLPRRAERRRVGDEDLLLRLPVDGQVEERIEDGERARTEERLRDLLFPLLESLPAEDRLLLLKLHYWDGFSMAAISPLLGRPQQELYSVRDSA